MTGAQRYYYTVEELDNKLAFCIDGGVSWRSDPLIIAAADKSPKEVWLCAMYCLAARKRGVQRGHSTMFGMPELSLTNLPEKLMS